MATSGARTMITVEMQKAVARLSAILRHKPISSLAEFATGSGTRPRRLTTRYAPHQEASHRIHDDGHQEQCQSDFDEGRKVEVACSFTELIRQHAGHGVAG